MISLKCLYFISKIVERERLFIKLKKKITQKIEGVRSPSF